MKKIILFNIIFSIIFLFLLECIGLVFYAKNLEQNFKFSNGKELVPLIKYTKARNYSTNDFLHLFTKTIPNNPSKRPVLVIGCSYVQGSGIKEEQTFSYKIFQKTNREVYKRGIPGGGIQLHLHQFETGEIQKDVPDAEYIIYVYTDYHLARLYEYQLDYIETIVNQRYKLKDEHLIKIRQPKIIFWYSSFCVKIIQQALQNIPRKKELDNFLLFNAVMQKMLYEAQKSYKNSKFVILLYPSTEVKYEKIPIMPESEIEKLEKMGFIVINAVNLTKLPIRTDEYRIEDRDHPNEKAWDAIVDNFVNQLKL